MEKMAQNEEKHSAMLASMEAKDERLANLKKEKARSEQVLTKQIKDLMRVNREQEEEIIRLGEENEELMDKISLLSKS